MSTIVVVLVFAGLGLGVLFAAFSTGPGGASAILQNQSRASRRFAAIGFSILFVLLFAVVPGVVIAVVHDRTDVPHAGVTNLTAQEKRGQELFAGHCSLCHTLKASNAVAQVGPNLDQLMPSEQLVLATINSGQSNGNGQMPAQLYVGQDAKDVAAYVAKATGGSTSGG